MSADGRSSRGQKDKGTATATNFHFKSRRPVAVPVAVAVSVLGSAATTGATFAVGHLRVRAIRTTGYSQTRTATFADRNGRVTVTPNLTVGVSLSSTCDALCVPVCVRLPCRCTQADALICNPSADWRSRAADLVERMNTEGQS